jgi:hypothetical protein
MKKSIVTLVFALFAFFATTAFAQGNFTLRADVPFSFSVGGHQYNAGSYELRSSDKNSTVRLVNMETGEVHFIKLYPSEQAVNWKINPPTLHFVVNGKRFYLVSLVEGYSNGWQVPGTFIDLGTVPASGRRPS